MNGKTDFFARFHRSALRLETRPFYGPDAEAFAVHQAGLPPTGEYQAVLDGWRAKVAAATSSAGLAREVGRILVVATPLDGYWRWRLDVLAEHARAGERIRLADRTWHPELARLTTDWWAFDLGTERATAVWMRYGPDGDYLGQIPASDPQSLARCQDDLAFAGSLAVSLDEFLAGAAG